MILVLSGSTEKLREYLASWHRVDVYLAIDEWESGFDFAKMMLALAARL